jgi:hypothetical protein
MSENLEYKLPSYTAKHIEEIKILFAVNSETREYESFVPMTLYLELLDKLENLTTKKANS